MFDFLLPRTAPFFSFLQQQNAYLVQAAQLVLNAMERADELNNSHKAMAIVEDNADALCVRIMRELSLTFITPIDREDILRINQCQEEGIDVLQALMTRMHIFEFTRVRFPALQLVRTLKQMVDLTSVMLEGLSHKQDCHKTRAFRNLRGDCEMLLSVGLAELYDIAVPTREDMLDLIKWGQAYDRMEHAVSIVIQLAEAIEEAVLKNV